jgi:hypothetical protein
MGSIMGQSMAVMWNIVDEGQRWGFARAQFFAVSVRLSAGSPSLPPRLNEVDLPPNRSVHDGGCAPHGPRRVVRRHNDVAESEFSQGPQRGMGADKGRRDDGGV